jgi:hypothetical protein
MLPWLDPAAAVAGCLFSSAAILAVTLSKLWSRARCFSRSAASWIASSPPGACAVEGCEIVTTSLS